MPRETLERRGRTIGGKKDKNKDKIDKKTKTRKKTNIIQKMYWIMDDLDMYDGWMDVMRKIKKKYRYKK